MLREREKEKRRHVVIWKATVRYSCRRCICVGFGFFLVGLHHLFCWCFFSKKKKKQLVPCLASRGKEKRLSYEMTLMVLYFQRRSRSLSFSPFFSSYLFYIYIYIYFCSCSILWATQQKEIKTIVNKSEEGKKKAARFEMYYFFFIFLLLFNS